MTREAEASAGSMAPGPRQQLSMHSILFWGGSYLVFALLALLTPKTVLDDWPQARTLVDFVAGIVPQIDRLSTRSGEAAQVNRFVYSLIWLLSPLYAAVMAAQGYRAIKLHGCTGYHSYGHFMAMLLGGGLLAAAMLFLPFGGQSRISQVLFAGDLLRALWAPIGAFGPILFIVAIALSLWCALTRRLRFEEIQS